MPIQGKITLADAPPPKESPAPPAPDKLLWRGEVMEGPSREAAWAAEAERNIPKPIKDATALYERDIADRIDAGGYPALRKGGRAALAELVRVSNAVWEATGRPVPIKELLDAGEEHAMASLRDLVPIVLEADERTAPQVRRARALAAIDRTLSRARSLERSGEATQGPTRAPRFAATPRVVGAATFERRAAREESAAEARARTRAAIEAAWKGNGR